MGLLTAYLLKATLASGLLYLYYVIALKNKKFHSYNRFYLLASVIISLVLPLIHFNGWYIETAPGTPLHHLANRFTAPITGHSFQTSRGSYLLYGTYACVSLFLLLSLLFKIRWIYSIKRKSHPQKMRGYTLIETDMKEAPFSFLSNLFWKRGLSVKETTGARIFKHELTHITQKHTYDKVFAQVLCCLFWINPFYWLIQRELDTIHEFIADAASVAAGDTESFALMLLQAHHDGSYLSPVHPFFNSSIKRRLLMIRSTNKTRYSYIRRIAALPLSLCLLALLSAGVKAQIAAKRNFLTVNAIKNFAPDTLPKTTIAPPPQSLEPTTVTGHRLKKPSPEPVTVSGHPSQKKAATEPVLITGQQLEQPSLEPITVTGHKIEQNATQEPVTVTGHKIERQPEPVTVTGHKLEKKKE